MGVVEIGRILIRLQYIVQNKSKQKFQMAEITYIKWKRWGFLYDWGLYTRHYNNSNY